MTTQDTSFTPGQRREVTFCFPFHGAGGVPMQFLRLSSILADRGWSVSLLDYADGTMAKNLRDPRVRIIEYKDDALVNVPERPVLVMQTMTPWSIFRSLRVAGSTRVLLWTCHPFNLVPTVPVLRKIVERGAHIGSPLIRLLLPLHWRRLKQYLRKLIERRSIVFMDVGTVRNTAAYLRERIDQPVYVPVPAPQVSAPETFARSSADRAVRVGWVGRIGDFKYPILSYSLRRLDEIAAATGLRITLTIVGAGEFLSQLQADAASLHRLSVEFAGELSPDQVESFLSSGLDLMLAMGTSALEGAAQGIPTILLDFTYGEVPSSYAFRWLHEREGYTLGELIGPEHLTPGDDGLQSRVTDVISNRERLGRRAREYVQLNHSIDAVADRFEMALLGVEATWDELGALGVFRRGFLYRLHELVKSGRRRWAALTA